MDMELNFLRTVTSIKANTWQENSMEKAHITGAMALYTKGNSKTE